MVSGQKVEWRWLYNAGSIGVRHAFAVMVFQANLLPDGRISGAVRIYPTRDEFNPSFEYKKDRDFDQPANFAATRLSAGPS